MNELTKNTDTDIMENYRKSDNIVSDMQEIINASQQQALQAVNIALVKRNWLIGYRIAEEDLNGDDRAEYGLNVIKRLSKELTKIYGKGFTKTNLYSFYSFINTFLRFSTHRVENLSNCFHGLIIDV